MSNFTHKENEWTINTVRNSPSIDVLVNGLTIPCRVLEQVIISPSGERITIEQHISNNPDYHGISSSRTIRVIESEK